MSADPKSRGYFFRLSRAAARVLSILSLGSLLGWFLLKFFLSDEAAALQLVVGLLGLVGMVTSVVLFLSSYSFRAHAPDTDIDEREVAERNRAYFRAYQVIWTVLALAYIALQLQSLLPESLFSRGVATNFLTVLMFLGLVLPACLLAWWDPGEEN